MAKRTRDYAAEYQRRKSLGFARGFTLSQARGHAKPTERKVSEVKKIAKETGTPIERIQKVVLGSPTKGETGETGWRQQSFKGFRPEQIDRFTANLPNRTRLWLIVEVDATLYYTIYAKGMKSTGEKKDKFYLTLITNRTKRDFVERLYDDFPLLPEGTGEEDMNVGIKESIVRFKPL